VPGLAAKPIIDCDIVVVASAVSPASQVIVSLGFRQLGELGIEHRWAFKEPARLAGTNTYVTIAGSLSLWNHLGVRDLLRADANLRDAYGELKLRLGSTARTIEEYGQGKNAMIQRILLQAGFTASERARIDGAQIPSRNDVPR
jgi:GrpB-like predicted nucleotidyltransferase (UPF0157 family)